MQESHGSVHTGMHIAKLYRIRHKSHGAHARIREYKCLGAAYSDMHSRKHLQRERAREGRRVEGQPRAVRRAGRVQQPRVVQQKHSDDGAAGALAHGRRDDAAGDAVHRRRVPAHG